MAACLGSSCTTTFKNSLYVGSPRHYLVVFEEANWQKRHQRQTVNLIGADSQMGKVLTVNGRMNRLIMKHLQGNFLKRISR